MNMRLLGATSIANITPDMVDTSNISSHIAAIPGDRLYEANCTHRLFFALPIACADMFLILRRKHATCSPQRDQAQDVEYRILHCVSFVYSRINMYRQIYGTWDTQRNGKTSIYTA